MPEVQTAYNPSELIKIRPTLIIGLGGTGGDVLLRIRKRIHEKFGSLSEFPIVAYLWIDTDTSEKHVLARDVQSHVGLSESEKRMATIAETAKITDHLQEKGNAGIERWWYPGLSSLGQLTEGAGLIRPYGRLAFFHHYKDSLRDAVRDALARMRDPAHKQKMESPLHKQLGVLGQVEFDQPANIYFIASLAGGTGSGMLLDVAFMVKDQLKEGDATTSAFLVLPDHFGKTTTDKMRANAYAALKELNYYKLGNLKFEAEWEPGVKKAVPIPPFDYCYLLDNQNGAGQVIGGPDSQELVYELLAESIVKDLSPGDFGDHKRTARVQLRPFMSNTYDHPHPRFKQRFVQRWSSLGMASISIPHARIVTACAYRLASYVVNAWGGLTGYKYNPAHIPHTVEEKFLPLLNLVEDDKTDKHDILGALLDPNGEANAGYGLRSGLLFQLTEWRRQVENEVAHHAEERQHQKLREYLEKATQDERAKLKVDDVAPEQWGEYARKLRINAQALVERSQQALRKESFQIVDDGARSIEYTIVVLTETAVAFKRYASQLQKKIDDLEVPLQAREAEVTRRMGELVKAEGRHNLDGRKHTILEYITLRYFDAIVGDAAAPGAMRCVLQKRLYQEGSEVCRRLADYVAGEVGPDGKRSGGLIASLQQLKDDLESLRQEFVDGYNYFSQKDHQSLSLVMYEAGDIEKTYYPAYISARDDVVSTGKDILRRLKRSVSGLTEDMASGRKDEWRAAVVQECRRKFARIPLDYHIVKEFFRRFDEYNRRNNLEKILSRSAFWATQSTLYGTFELPESQIQSMVGLPAVPAGMPPNEAAEMEGWLARIKETVLKEDPKVKFYTVPETSEILFYQEAGGFPVNYVARLADLRKSYLGVYTAGEPLHIDRHDKKFPDLTVLTPEEREALEEAFECYLFGCLFNELKFGDGEYTWLKQDGFRQRPYPLGDKHMLVVKLAADEALRRELFGVLMERREELLSSANMEDLARYYTLLDNYKLDAWGDRWGKAGTAEELEFDNMMVVLAVEDEEKRVLSAGPVRKDPSALNRRAAALAASPWQFAREREDGRWAMVKGAATVAPDKKKR